MKASFYFDNCLLQEHVWDGWLCAASGVSEMLFHFHSSENQCAKIWSEKSLSCEKWLQHKENGCAGGINRHKNNLYHSSVLTEQVVGLFGRVLYTVKIYICVLFRSWNIKKYTAKDFFKVSLIFWFWWRTLKWLMWIYIYSPQIAIEYLNFLLFSPEGAKYHTYSAILNLGYYLISNCILFSLFLLIVHQWYRRCII